MIYIFLALNIFLLVTGQMLWKIGMSKNIGFNIINIILSPYIISGIILYGIATILWLYILSKEELSFVYPLQSITYVIGTIIAILVFHENVSILRWIGIITIVMGAMLVVKG